MQNDGVDFKYCPGCGQQPPSGANFCNRCGTPVRHGLAENQVWKNEKSTNQKKDSKGSRGGLGWLVELFSWLYFWQDD